MGSDGKPLSFDGYETLEQWSEATGQEKIGDILVGRTIDPQLVDPNLMMITDPTALEDMLAYRLKPNSPCIGAGILVENNGGRDFWSNPVSDSEKPAIGAFHPTN